MILSEEEWDDFRSYYPEAWNYLVKASMRNELQQLQAEKLRGFTDARRQKWALERLNELTAFSELEDRVAHRNYARDLAQGT